MGNLKVEYNKEIIEKFKEIHIAADHIGSVLFVLLALDEQRIDLLNVIDEAEIQSNVFIDRGKYSGLERLERLGEIDNIGDLIKYGYGFFDIKTT